MSQYKDTRRANDMLRAQLEAEQERKEKFAEEWKFYFNEIQKFDGWESWWDNYPNNMSKAEFLPILKARVEELRKEHELNDDPNIMVCDTCPREADIRDDPHAWDDWMGKDGKHTCPDCIRKESINKVAMRC